MLDWHSCQTCYPLEKKLLLLLYYIRLKPASHDVAQIMIIQRNNKMKFIRNRSRLL